MELLPHIPSFFVLFFVSSISAWFFWAILRRRGSDRRNSGLPPSPMALPIIGHLHLLGTLPHRSLHKLSQRFGPLIFLRLGSVPAIVASSADTAEQILKSQESCFASRRQPSALRHLSYGEFDMAWSPYGPYWKFLKKLSVSKLFGSRTLEQTMGVRREEIERLLLLLLKKSETGEAVDVSAELSKMTNNVISRMAMRRVCTGSDREMDDMQKVVHEALMLMGTTNLSDYIELFRNLDVQGLKKRSEDARRRFDALVEKIIREHEKAKKARGGEEEDGQGVKNVLDGLLDALEDEGADMKLTRDQIKAFLLGILAGGTDTSSSTISWALSELINHPDKLAEARAEVDSIVGKQRLATESDIPNLLYIQAIVKETFRLHPTIPLILRECTDACKINGYDIPVHSQVFISVWAIGRDPGYWDRPLEFLPERFMPPGEVDPRRQSCDIDVRGQDFQLVPFGSGRRGCPGTNLALHVMHTTLALMVQCFDWKFGSGEGKEVLDMTEGTGLSLPRAQPLVCVPVARLNPFPSVA